MFAQGVALWPKQIWSEIHSDAATACRSRYSMFLFVEKKGFESLSGLNSLCCETTFAGTYGYAYST
jgi:hypothetical protein